MIWHYYGILFGHVRLLEAFFVWLLVLGVFLRWERQGRAVWVVLAALGVDVIDATLYPTTGAMRVAGVFHPNVAGQSIRLAHVIIAAGLVARVLARGLPTWADRASLLWFAFFGWYVTAGVSGLLEGHSGHLVVARAALALEAGGMLALAAGVPAREYLADHGFPRFTRLAGVLAAALTLMSAAHVTVTSPSGFLPLIDAGEMGADGATVFASIGLVAVAIELTRRNRSILTLIAGVVCVVSLLASTQRAARLGLAVSVATFLLAVLLPRARRIRLHRRDLAIGAAVVVSVVAGTVFVRGATGDPNPSPVAAVPFSSYTVQAVSSDYRQGSVESRYIGWAKARSLIRSSPLVGHGLGETFTHYDVGMGDFIDFDNTNNIVLDLLLRTGAVGLLLFCGAAAATFVSAWRTWRSGRSPTCAVVALMSASVLAGFLAKGMVESVLNEFHLTPLLGFLLGLVAAMARTDRDELGIPGDTTWTAVEQ
jgi:O-antigen ligase